MQVAKLLLISSIGGIWVQDTAGAVFRKVYPALAGLNLLWGSYP
jgi:hypothetical protein